MNLRNMALCGTGLLNGSVPTYDTVYEIPEPAYVTWDNGKQKWAIPEKATKEQVRPIFVWRVAA